jgi:phage gp46-like protein
MSNDLSLVNRSLDIQVSGRDPVDLRIERGDLKLATGRYNLAQAILNRLLTRQSELADLGHPDYGSRLHLLTGEPNTQRTQVLAELYIRESLAREPRVKEIASVVFLPPSRSDKREVMDARIVVRPANGDPPLTLSIEVNPES